MWRPLVSQQVIVPDSTPIDVEAAILQEQGSFGNKLEYLASDG